MLIPAMVATVPTVFTAAPASVLVRQRSFRNGFTIVPAMLMLFELFVGLIQAFVFGMLTMVFMAQATQGHGEEHAEAH